MDGMVGAPHCVCRHGFYAHAPVGFMGERSCELCGCKEFRIRGGQVRLVGVWTGA